MSEAIMWPSASIPATGHYCRVGLISTNDDPAPALTDFMNWDNYLKFIRVNNNVTWRNFNVVNNLPPSEPGPGVPKGFVPLPFIVPGAPDEARKMDLEVIARLPKGGCAILEAPLYLLDALGQRGPHCETKKGVGRIPLHAQGRHLLGESLLAARSKARLRLFVHIPEALREHPYDIAVRQIYREQEVGRVTWRLARGNQER